MSHHPIVTPLLRRNSRRAAHSRAVLIWAAPIPIPPLLQPPSPTQSVDCFVICKPGLFWIDAFTAYYPVPPRPAPSTSRIVASSYPIPRPALSPRTHPHPVIPHRQVSWKEDYVGCTGTDPMGSGPPKWQGEGQLLCRAARRSVCPPRPSRCWPDDSCYQWWPGRGERNHVSVRQSPISF